MNNSLLFCIVAALILVLNHSQAQPPNLLGIAGSFGYTTLSNGSDSLIGATRTGWNLRFAADLLHFLRFRFGPLAGNWSIASSRKIDTAIIPLWIDTLHYSGWSGSVTLAPHFQILETNSFLYPFGGVSYSSLSITSVGEMSDIQISDKASIGVEVGIGVSTPLNSIVNLPLWSQIEVSYSTPYNEAVDEEFELKPLTASATIGLFYQF